MYDLGKNETNGARPMSPSGLHTATVVEGLRGPMPEGLGRAIAVGLMHPIATREADVRSARQLVAI